MTGQGAATGLGTARKIATAALAIVLAGLAAGNAIRASEMRSEAGVLSGLPQNRDILLVQAEQRAVAAYGNHAIKPAAVRAARSSLVWRPLDAQMLVFIGLASQGGDTATGPTARLMKLADRVSRREPISQIWAIEQASAAGDVQGAVRHYHTVLSSNPQLFPALFPVLGNAIDFPEVRAALKPYITPQSPWLFYFLAYASDSAKLDSLTALLGPDYAILRQPQYDNVNANILVRLAQSAHPGDAITFGRKAIAGFDEKAFASFDVTAVTSVPQFGKLGWTLGSGDGVTASLDDSDSVQISSGPGSKGIALSRYFPVDPRATYTLAFRFSVPSEPRPATLTWKATCASDPGSQQTWQENVAVTASVNAVTLNLPSFPGCGLVQFQLVVTGPEGQLPATFSMSKLVLNRR